MYVSTVMFTLTRTCLCMLHSIIFFYVLWFLFLFVFVDYCCCMCFACIVGCIFACIYCLCYVSLCYEQANKKHEFWASDGRGRETCEPILICLRFAIEPTRGP